ncbi:MAG: hypothetical protein GY748_10895 [Planctomycetaceae bacterium]|nr:hypothetical protein [Planctomycetaceae bacterium]
MNSISTFFTTCIVALVLSSSAQLSHGNDQVSPRSNAIYAKIILPVESPDQSPSNVESWISKNLNKRGEKKFRAVTQWIRLPEPGEEVALVWDARLDNKRWGCPVSYRSVKRTKDGKIKIEIQGFSPAEPEITGQTIDAGIGSRGIAVVDTGGVNEYSTAYIALFVGPTLPTEKSNQE